MSSSEAFDFNREKVASLLEKEMLMQGWQATSLARKAKLHDHAVFHFLNKKTRNVEKLKAIAEVLGKDISYFLIHEEDVKKRPVYDDIPYNGQLVREAMQVVEDIMQEKGIPLSKSVVDNFTETVYKHSQRKDRDGKISREYALGVIEYALDNNLVTCKSS